MGKSLLPTQIKEEAARLALMPEAEVKKAIDAMDLDMSSRAILKAEIAGLRVTAVGVGKNDPEDLMMAAGLGGVTAAAITDRVKKLLAGETRTFPDRLILKELAARLTARLPDLEIAPGFDTISVLLRESSRMICVIRLVAVDGGGTSVSMSRAETKQVKEKATGFFGSLAKKALGGKLGEATGDLLNQGAALASSVTDTIGDMVQLEAVLGTIEDYAAELAQARQTAELANRQAQAKAAEDLVAKTQCPYCGTARTTTAACTCSKCGATLPAVQS